MNSRLAKHAWIFSSVAAVCLLNCHGVARAQLVGDPQPLLDAAKLYRENLDALKTWEGEIEYSFRRKGAKEAHFTVVECKIRFALARDCQPPLAVYDIEIVTDAIDQNEALVPRQPLKHLCGLVCDEVLYELQYENDKPKSARIVGAKPYRPRHDGGWSYAVYFDPVFFVTDNGVHCDKTYEFYAKEAMNPALKAHLTSDGTVLMLTHDPRPGRGDGYDTISLANSGNLVDRLVVDHSPSTASTARYKWTWEEQNHVDVPKTASKDVHGVNVEYHFALTWTKNVVNQPLNMSRFTLASIGARKGDVLLSAEEGRQVIDDPTILPAPTVIPRGTVLPAR